MRTLKQGASVRKDQRAKRRPDDIDMMQRLADGRITTLQFFKYPGGAP
jgi:hypothetical protein